MVGILTSKSSPLSLPGFARLYFSTLRMLKLRPRCQQLFLLFTFFLRTKTQKIAPVVIKTSKKKATEKESGHFIWTDDEVDLLP